MKFVNEKGQTARLFLVLAAVVLVAVIIVYLVMRMANPAPKPQASATPTVPLPVYETKIGNVRFVFMSAIDRGSTLRASQIKNQNFSSYTKDLSSTARFIEVTVGAQNKGTENTQTNDWDIENIVDSEGRNFVPSGYEANPWLPTQNNCGALLKPSFDPTPCTKIYEVSKESTGLTIRVLSGKGVNSGGKAESALIDLIVK